MKTFLAIAILLLCCCHSVPEVAGKERNPKREKELNIKQKYPETNIKRIFIPHNDDQIYSDTIEYDLLSNRLDTTKRINRWILSSLITVPRMGTLEKESGYDKFEGKIIDSIYIIRTMPFNEEEGSNFTKWARKLGNNLHVLTREKEIRNNLLFQTGDPLNPNIMERNEVLLRNLAYISNAHFIIKDIGNNRVIVYVYTKDNLSLGASLEYHGHKDSYFTIYDDNFLGRGNEISIKDHFNWGEKDLFKAVELSHNFSNIWGTFNNLRTTAGIGKNFYVLSIESNKEFIKPTDYAGGLKYEKKRFDEQQTLIDTTLNVQRQLMHIWMGKSFQLNKKGMSLYFSLKWQKQNFYDRPVTASFFNPYYHNSTGLISSVGLYKENFYRGNLIYGFGYTEDIPYGFRLELTGGYNWNEYRNMPYAGFNIGWGHRTLFGYINTGFNGGTYFNEQKKLQQTVLNLNLFYFSNLIPLRREFSLRQFFRFGYTHGNHMLFGERQSIAFAEDYRIKGASIDKNGLTRMYIAPETVIFSPWHLWGFRFALYSYLDMGMLGINKNPFKNEFFSSLGIGIRIKNENLVFRTIQIRFSVLLRKTDYIHGSWFNINNEQKLTAPRFIPKEPQFIEFR